jgi:AcrR family transcriptional regulator
MPPRRGLTPERVVDAAAEIADRDGYGALTLGAVADALEVRTPSLYNHGDGLDDLRRRVTVRAIERLGDALQRAAVGRSTDDAVRAIAAAFRRFALEHPGLYAATVPSSEVGDEAVRRAGRAVVETVLAALSGYGLDHDEAIHAARGLRAAVHGFVALELAGGFGLEQPTEDSFAWLTDVVMDGVRARVGADA